VDVACGTRGRDEKCIKNCGRILKGSDHAEGLGPDGRIILKWILGK